MKEAFTKMLPWGVALILVAVVMKMPVMDRFVLPRMGMSEDGVVSKMARGTEMMIAPEPMPPIYGGGDDLGNPIRSMVRYGSLEVITSDVSSAVSATAEYVRSVKGLVLQSSINTYRGTVTGSMNLRVPEESFDVVMGWLQKQGKKVESLSMSSYDQTGQVTNTEERLGNLQDELANYQALLENASGSEKLKIQRQIDSLTDQIKNWQQQRQNLEEQAAMSQISITYTKKAFGLPVIGSLDLSLIVQQALDALIAMVQMVVMLAIFAVVFVPIWLPTVLIVKKLQKPKMVK